MAAFDIAVRASVWNALDVLVRQGIQFIVFVTLARLLTPEDFGTVALLALFTSLSIVFVQGGLSIAIIQRQRTTAEEESAIFWWNLGGSILMAGAIIVAGPLLADFFDQPILRSLVLLSAAQLIFSAAGAVHTARFTKEMRFDLLTKASLFSSSVSGGAAVLAALLGAGVWALGLQIVTAPLLNTIALWKVGDWRPGRHFRFRIIRELFGFGAWVSVGNVLEVLYTNGLNLLVGKLHGVRDLGFFNQASATQSLPSSVLSTIFARVSLPLLASNQDDPEAQRRNLRLAIRSVMLLNLPLMAGLAMLSNQIVVVLFGEQWLPTAPILSILAIGGILLPLHVINLQLVLATGESATFMRIEIIKKGLGLTCLIVGSFFGIIGLAWSQVVYSALGFFVNSGPAHRKLEYGPVRQLSDLASIASVTLLMAGVVYLVTSTIRADPLTTLVACTLCGAVFYGVVGFLSASTVFREPIVLLGRMFLSIPLTRGR